MIPAFRILSKDSDGEDKFNDPDVFDWYYQQVSETGTERIEAVLCTNLFEDYFKDTIDES